MEGATLFGHWQSDRTNGTAWYHLLFHLACCMQNAIITFFMTPPHVTRKVVQNTRPSSRFSGVGSRHETCVVQSKLRSGDQEYW